MIGEVVNNGFNFATDDSFGNPYANLGLGTIGQYRGEIETLPLLPESPAREHRELLPFPATDARGVTRPGESWADAGSFEYHPNEDTQTFLNAEKLGTNGLQIRGIDPLRRRSVLEMSSNLKLWGPILTNSPGHTQWEYEAVLESSAAFFRLRSE